MKAKKIALIALGTLLAATLGIGTLAACGEDTAEVKPSEYTGGINYYYGDGEDVHLQGWIASQTDDAWTIEEGYTDTEAEGSPVVTHLGYSKNDAWRNFGVKIDGEYSDFAYLNITMRARARLTEGAVSVNMKIVNPVTGRENMNVLGFCLYVAATTEVYTTYTFEIPSKYRQILDVTNDVCLFPEPGIENSATIHAGDIYVKDMWFSKERPADGVTPVDDTWRTEAWCGYEVTRGGENEAVISYNNPADWSRFYRPVLREEIFLEDGTVNNMLKLQFTSDTVTLGDTVYEDSVEQFQFGIWGDPNPGTEAAYYQQWYGQYYREKYEEGRGGKCPAELPEEIAARIHALTRTLYEAFGMRGIVRADFLVVGEEVFFNELNMVPGSLAGYLLGGTLSGTRRLLEEVITDALARPKTQKHIIHTGILTRGVFSGAKSCKRRQKIV